MRICYVSYEFPPQFGGGIGTYVGNISRNLVDAGHEVHVLTYNPGNLADYELEGAVQVHRISMADSQMEIIDHAGSSNLSTLLYWSLYSEKVYHHLKCLQSKYRFDVIEFCDYRGEAYFSALAKRTRKEFWDVPLIIRLHTSLSVLNVYNNAENEPGMEQLVNFENTAMLLVDGLVSPSKILAEIIKSNLGLIKDIPVVPHPIDVELFPRVGKVEDSETILYVGRLENRKGVIELVKAMQPVLREYTNCELKLIGGDTDTGPNGTSMKEYLKSLIASDVQSRVKFADRMTRNDVIQQYSGARVCVFPSLFENFPNVCLEAMAATVPVVVSHNSGMAEMVEDGVSGIVFEAGNVEDLKNKIMTAYDMPLAQRISMGAAARKRIEEWYSKDVVNELHSDYYRSLKSSSAIEVNSTGKYETGLVSVVVPCFNHGEFIEETISSVLGSTYTNLEIIVVNDGSTDEKTLNVLNSLQLDRVKVVHQENSGLSAARNTGVMHSKGEFILPIDADDLIARDFIEKTVNVLNKDPLVGFVYTHVKFVGAADGVWKTPEFDPNLLLVSNLCVASSLYRRVAFDQIGGYKTDMVYGFEDWDFWIYMVEAGWKGKCIAEPLFFYRKHQESMLSSSQRNRSFLIQKLIEHHLETYKRSLAYVVVEKDKQFFEAHMSSYSNHMQLSSVMSSKAWKVIKVYRKIKEKALALLGEKA